ncbi:IS3 family transposase (plasmid) [Deefgea piscis]|uniref:IS3 family transposase n=1 Tax=Deefgea piscis TaxID=2739061 RepID=A0A6M8SYW1_9NEIS|nr:IS3 family transposase [Deefgea piscis]
MTAKYAFIKAERLHYPVKILCRVLSVSRAGFYGWMKRAPSKRHLEDAKLRIAIRTADTKTRSTYGAKRLQDELADDGIIAGRDRIARLRREAGIRCIQKRKFKATTNSNHALPVTDNLLGQEFKPTRPNQVWVSDITYVSTDEGWLYLAGIKDVFTCEIVGYAMGARMT